MKRIFIPPRHLQYGDMPRFYGTTTISDLLIEEGCLPLMPTYHTGYGNPLMSQDLALNYMDHLMPDGIIFQGGSDVTESLYTQNSVKEKDVLFRDYFELALVTIALERKVPIFGVCRGLQLINIALGGTLHSHLHEDAWHKHIHLNEGEVVEENLQNIRGVHHPVHLEKGGVLHTLFGHTEIEVNSIHHQGIDKLADTLQVEARSPDHLIEAVSNKEKGILAVQWHPEYDFADPTYRKPMLEWLSWIGK